MSVSVFSENVFAAVRDFGMSELSDTVTVALSGGADSVSLLRVIIEGGFFSEIHACHLNHGIRGEESDADEEFCRNLCNKLGIPIKVKRVNIPKLRENHESIEEAARRIRYDFFRDCVEGSGGIIATAHTASDNTETVLFNLTRGTGAAGLCGIPPVRISDGLTVIRPLIYCTRADVEKYLSALSQDHVTDKTNLCTDYSRNRIRLNVIPELEKINPSLSRSVSRMTKSLRADNEFLDGLTVGFLERFKSGRGWIAAELNALPEPIKLRAVRKILQDGGIEPSALRISTAAELLGKRSARYNPCKDKFFTIRKGICFTENIRQNYGGYNEKKG